MDSSVDDAERFESLGLLKGSDSSRSRSKGEERSTSGVPCEWAAAERRDDMAELRRCFCEMPTGRPRDGRESASNFDPASAGELKRGRLGPPPSGCRQEGNRESGYRGEGSLE